MSKNAFELVDTKNLSKESLNCEPAANCLMSMGITAENVVEKYGITREQQD